MPETHTSEHPSQIRGAAPAGATDSQSAARAIQEMFTAIAPRYDLLNHLLSANVDKLWWWRTALTFGPVLSRPNARVLDLCCGTGDMAFALWREGPRAQIVGADFSHAMLKLASLKSGDKKALQWIEADALKLPFPDQSFDLVTSAFGFRNLADYDAGLREIWRVLKSGGVVGILEFSEPGGLLGKLYKFYFKRILPRIGRIVSRTAAYSYLPPSVERFPSPPQVLERMRAARFQSVSWTPYTLGIAGLFYGVK